MLAAVVVLGIEPVSRATDAGDGNAPSRLAELTAGFLALRTYPAAGILISLLSMQTMVRGVLTVLLVAVSVELLGLGASGVGYLNAAIGAGALAGAFAAFTLVLRPRLAGPFSVGLAFWGIPVMLLGLTAQPLIAFASMAVLGLANAILDVSAFSLIQRVVPNRLRGRVFGALEAIAGLTFGIGSLLAPVLVALLGLQMALVVSGGLLPLLAALSATLVRRADAGAIVPHRQLDLLRGVPMFAPLPMTALEQLAGGLVAEQHDRGVNVIRQEKPASAGTSSRRGPWTSSTTANTWRSSAPAMGSASRAPLGSSPDRHGRRTRDTGSVPSSPAHLPRGRDRQPARVAGRRNAGRRADRGTRPCRSLGISTTAVRLGLGRPTPRP